MKQGYKLSLCMFCIAILLILFSEVYLLGMLIAASVLLSAAIFISFFTYLSPH